MAGRADSGRDHQACATLAELATGPRAMRGTAELWRRAIELRARASRPIARAQALRQRTSGLIDESRRLRRIPSIPAKTPMSAPHSSRRPDAEALRCHLAWHLVAMLIVLTGQVTRSVTARSAAGAWVGVARVELASNRQLTA
jgi:hypothetical protein